MLKIETFHTPPISTASVNNRQHVLRAKLHNHYLEQMKNIRRVNEAHMKHRRDVDLINEYANLNRHVAYGTAAYAVFIGNNIDAFV